MPEGPSIVILRDLLKPFEGKIVQSATGYAKIDLSKLKNKKLISVRSWGKHLLLGFKDFTVRIHLMMFGSYRINETKETNPTLHLSFSGKKEINFYTCSVKLLEEDINTTYNWSADIMSDQWDPSQARKSLKEHPDLLACDVLLDQSIFSGSGNIIKNEVLFRTRIHPLSIVGKIPAKQLNLLIKDVREYAFDFLKWKKEYTLKQHWQAYTKKTCPRCNTPLEKEYLGTTHRRTFFCNNCQHIYE